MNQAQHKILQLAFQLVPDQIGNEDKIDFCKKNKTLLVLRSFLIYLQKMDCKNAEDCMEEFSLYFMEQVEIDLDKGLTPNLTTLWPDRYLLSKIDLRFPSLVHDCLYGVCESQQDRLVADMIIRDLVKRLNPSWYGRTWAMAIYRVLRLFGRNHCQIKPHPKHLLEAIKMLISTNDDQNHQ